MFSVILISVLSAAVAGLLIKFYFDRFYNPNQYYSAPSITWTEFTIGMLVIALIITPVVGKIGWNLAKQSNLTFNEYWNGWEKQVVTNVKTCTRDGPCSYEYDCDPYLVSYSCNCDNKGNCDTCWRTEYHSCPYVNRETNYVVQTTLGDFVIAYNRFPENPQANRWRSGVSVPQYVIDRAGVGAPPFWLAVKARIDSGKPGPVTKRAEYDNYILASDRTILKQYSSAIEEYRKANLLPPVQSGVYDFYYADKVQFVGYKPANPKEWQKALCYLNAAFGSELKGDLHLIIVQNETVNNNPDKYILALKAYWQNREIFKRDTISKNSVIVVIGTTNGVTVEWMKATTGMPLGNEEMIVAIRNTKGIPLTPESVIGEVKGKFDFKTKAGVIGEHGNGALEKIFWGLDKPQIKFKRVAMTGKSGAGSGFLYLSNEIDITGWQRFWIIFVIFVLTLGVWATAAFAANISWRSWFSDKKRR